jgi:hypothetical protein
MTTAPQTISAATEEFLNRFDAATSDPSIDVGEFFHDPFLAVDPTSVHALTPALLAKVLPARRAMFASAGIRHVQRIASRETPIDESHRLVRVEWSAERTDGPALELSSTFILRTMNGRTSVLVYLNHADIRTLLGSPGAEH